MHFFHDPVCQDILRASKDLDVPAHLFRPLSPTEEWQSIENKICKAFVKIDYWSERPCRLWERFKQESYSISYDYKAFDDLNKLVDAEEMVWLIVNGRNCKFWFYEGVIASIVKILNETYELDEVYVCSKKYRWLLCINHHRYLIATGDVMVERLKLLD